MPRARRIHPALALLALAVAPALTGCGQAQQAAGNVASAAASAAGGQATDAMKKAAADAVVSAVCSFVDKGGPLSDGVANAQDRTLLSPFAQQLDGTVPVPAEFAGPIRTIAAASTDEATRAPVAALTRACAARPKS
jgi:hypothetical protein